MTGRIAVFGGSFNPPGLHHRAVVEALAPHFDEIVIVPCGPRPDKATTNDIEPVHRAVMVDMTFRGIPNARVELFDLEQATFTRTHALQQLFAPRGAITHVVGTDLVRDGKDGASSIQREWENGRDLWETANFAVVAREGYDPDPADLPPHHRIFVPGRHGASTNIRELAFKHLPLWEFVAADVAAYIERYNLYRGAVPVQTTKMRLADPKAIIVADEMNPNAAALAARLADFAAPDDKANCVITVGGDGTMLRAIRKHWRKRLPFVGVNAGHRGYLLNDADEIQDAASLFEDLRVHLLSLLYVEIALSRGGVSGQLVFNDAWVERAGSQCAWLEVKVDGRVRIPKLVADGALVATAAGSTAYARAMGATPLLADAQAYLLVGSNVLAPSGWKSAPLSFASSVQITSLDREKRPLWAYCDGVCVGAATGMRARASRVAAVELAFSPHRDIAEKLADDLFPPS